MSKVVGIDLGTSNSCVAILEDGQPKVLIDEEGRKTTPSVFAIGANQEPIVGYPAKEQASTNREETIFAVKRLIGRKFGSEEVTEARDKLPYSVVAADNNDAWVTVNSKMMSPEEISSHVLVRMKEVAEHYLGERVYRAVITVPAHFNDSQRQATKDAGKLAGLDVLRIINEPTAAALAYGLNIVQGKDVMREAMVTNNRATGQIDRRIAVFDLGGGTFDISILELSDGVFDVKATNGDTYLGGEDFDMAIVDYLLEEFKTRTGMDVTGDKKVLQRFKTHARDAKHDLSHEPKCMVDIPWVRGMESFQVNFDRRLMEEIVRPCLRRLEEPCLTALEDADLVPEDITDVILVGGMTRMPAVKKAAWKIFGQEPLDSLDPDEAVALGAAVQAGLLQGLVKGVSLLDVTSLSLGIEVQGGKTHTLISRNTTIPAVKTEIFTTSAPNQPQVSIHVLQGESDFAPDNKSLGRMELKGIRPAPRGVPDIAISFEVDAEGIVHVSAKDLDTGQEQTIEIVASSGLDDYEIDRLIREQMMEQEQKERRQKKQAGELVIDEEDEDDELAEVKGKLKTAIFLTQTRLNTEGKRFKGRARARLDDSLDNARELLRNGENSEDFEAAVVDLHERNRALEEYLETLW